MKLSDKPAFLGDFMPLLTAPIAPVSRSAERGNGGRVDPCNAGHRDGRRVASALDLSFSLSAPLTDPYTVRGFGFFLANSSDLTAEQPHPKSRHVSLLCP